MKLPFWKMQGSGNDFLVLNALDKKFNLTREEIKKIADRHFGVGCDQVLVLEQPRDENEDFYYRIFNSDGSEVGQCGNGARCMGLFIRSQGLSKEKKIRLGTFTSQMVIQFGEGGLVEVNMREPIFAPMKIPFIPEKIPEGIIETSQGDFEFFVLSLGNPHAVTRVAAVDLIDVNKIGKEISIHPAFPDQTNVIFVEIINHKAVKCRIYERGVGETLACGSGACAAVIAGTQWKMLDNQVNVFLPGGKLEVNVREKEVWLKGDAIKVFEGIIENVESAGNA
ncbi:MAG: diaminopimelate epimerase [uncultured bacterium]|nr:MAG: diaminopimelate epimerase [uncultured bacterium]OGT23641.1 MAG: diaminopimelate epimerase [Gammaproteobacteria bacterium RIFCSPHIGHO2_12_38_15]OGT67179.1 MAG: diaminopimelate epimerase [Gammaproteobacteria bacterium RIFCSPLOWO2_02_FULL_38_11]